MKMVNLKINLLKYILAFLQGFILNLIFLNLFVDMMNQGGPQQHHGHDRHGPPDRHSGPDRHGQQDRHHHDRSRDNRGHFGGGHHDGGRGRGGHDRGGGDRGGPDRGGPDRDRDRRQSRWEQSQPTRGDQEKLQELMSEAGISGFYKDTMSENQPNRPSPGQGGQQQNSSNQAQMFPPQLQNIPAPLLPLLPQFLPQMMPQGPGMPQVSNPALANVLAQLNIPSTTIAPPNIPNYPPPTIQPKTSQQSEVQNAKPTEDTSAGGIPENLPKMQRELFRRIQQQQLKNENKVVSNFVLLLYLFP